MTRIALFHSVLGIRRGVLDAADAFRQAGHQVLIVDQYDGRVFDDYDEANRFAASIGFPALQRMALAAVADDPGPLVAVGFSNGAGMAEYVAAARGGAAGGVAGTVQFSGALSLGMLGLSDWPVNTPVQLHYTRSDPNRNDGWIDAFVGEVTGSGSTLEAHLDYPGSGHLFTDASLPDEYDEASAALAFERALSFIDRLDGGGKR